MNCRLRTGVVEGLEYRGTSYIMWDEEMPGFGVRVWSNGKAYVLNAKIKGRAKRKTIGSVGVVSLSDAREKAKELKARIQLGEDPFEAEKKERDKWTLKDALGYFLTDYAARRKLSYAYKADVKRLANNHFSKPWLKKPIADFTREEITKKHEKMSSVPRRANFLLQILSKLFTLSIERGERADNPCKGIKRFSETQRDRFLSEREIVEVWKYLVEHNNKEAASCVMLILATGCRPGEAFKAEWKHFDLENRFWFKPATNTKQRKIHKVNLNSRAVLALRRLETDKYSRYVFPSPKDPKKPREKVRAFWEALRKNLSLPGVRLYDVRHTFASQTAMLGVDMFTLKDMMGHSSVKTTERYVHIADDHQRKAAELFASLIPEESDLDQIPQTIDKKGALIMRTKLPSLR